MQEYKPPSSKDIPEDFRVRFHDSKRNSKAGVFGAKAVGEQASLMACSAVFALRRAIDSVKQDLGQNQLYYQLGNFFVKSVVYEKEYWLRFYLGGAVTPEKLQLTTGLTSEDFVL